MKDLSSENYRKYLSLKLPEEPIEVINEVSKTHNSFYGNHYLSYAKEAAKVLRSEYDLGIGLAKDGLWLQFVFDHYGMPTKAVRLNRKGKGAIWKPIDNITREDVNNKKIILFDNDAITGRTLKRAVKELENYYPEFIDLMLIHKHTPISLSKYKEKYEKYISLSDLKNYIKDGRAEAVISNEHCTRVFKEDDERRDEILINLAYRKGRKNKKDRTDLEMKCVRRIDLNFCIENLINKFFIFNSEGSLIINRNIQSLGLKFIRKYPIDSLYINTSINIPSGIRKVMTLDDFKYG